MWLPELQPVLQMQLSIDFCIIITGVLFFPNGICFFTAASHRVHLELKISFLVCHEQLRPHQPTCLFAPMCITLVLLTLICFCHLISYSPSLESFWSSLCLLWFLPACKVGVVCKLGYLAVYQIIYERVKKHQILERSHFLLPSTMKLSHLFLLSVSFMRKAIALQASPTHPPKN